MNSQTLQSQILSKFSINENYATINYTLSLFVYAIFIINELLNLYKILISKYF
nr:MAG TPA: hypothetical protein [Caudoviricetes sp.]